MGVRFNLGITAITLALVIGAEILLLGGTIGLLASKVGPAYVVSLLLFLALSGLLFFRLLWSYLADAAGRNS